MKNLIPIYIFLSFIFIGSIKTRSSTLNEVDKLNNKKEITVTFDEAEGNYLFFTDENREAIQFEEINAKETKKYDLIYGDNVGEIFTINYDDQKIISLKKVDKITD